METEKKFSREDVLNAANEVIKQCSDFVNAGKDHDERMARDGKVYPMVFGVNMLANMLMYDDFDNTKAYMSIAKFYRGEEFKDKDTGRPMRKVVGEDEGK